jgi:raffinose/stachyose/melibiose transport system substrate-binding protein
MFPVPLADNTGFATSAGGVVHTINKNSPNLDAARQYLNFLAEDQNLKTFYTARKDLGEPAFQGIEVSPPSVSLKSIYDVVGTNTGQELGDSVKFWNASLLGKQIQDMLVGSATPLQVLQKADADRDKTFKTTQN